MLKSLIYTFLSAPIIFNSTPIQNILESDNAAANGLVYEFGSLFFEQIEATKISIDDSNKASPKIYTNGSIKLTLDSYKIKADGFMVDGNRIAGKENIYETTIKSKGVHSFKITPIDGEGSVITGTINIILDDPKIDVINPNSDVSKNVVKNPYSNNVVNTFYSSTNAKIVFTDSKIASVNLYNVDDNFLNPTSKQVIQSQYSLTVNGNYLVEVTDNTNDKFLYFIRVGEWNNTSEYRFVNFWQTQEGVDLKAKANYHSKDFYNDEWFNNATTSEINFLLSISQNWPLPPIITNNNNIIIIGSIAGGVGLIGTSVGGYFLYRWYHKNKKIKNNRDRQILIENRKKKAGLIIEPIKDKDDITK